MRPRLSFGRPGTRPAGLSGWPAFPCKLAACAWACAPDTPWINDVRAALTSQRRAAQLDLTDIQLRRGQHGALLTGLAAQASEHPSDERVAGQLILACYRSGRQAEALAGYQQIRQYLADELGVNLRGYDPSQPVPAADALAGFLRALGVPSRDIPPETGERPRIQDDHLAITAGCARRAMW